MPPKGARPGPAGSYIAGLVREGLSASGALRAYRGAGGSIRTQTWYRAWGETVAAIGRAGAIGAAPGGSRPLASELSAGAWRTKERYTFMVDVLVRPTGTSEVFRMPMAVTSDRLLTYDEALNQAIDYANADLEKYGESVIGGVTTAVYDRELYEG